MRNHPAHNNRQRWNKVKAAVFAAEPLCRMCAAKGRDVAAEELDHIVPVSQGGNPWARSNLQPLCARHHGIKSKRERESAAKRICPHGYAGEFKCPDCHEGGQLAA